MKDAFRGDPLLSTQGNSADLRSKMLKLSPTLVRPLQHMETAHAMEWAVNEGWNPGLFDTSVFFAADPGSFLTVEVEGKPAGVISASRMSDDFGFIGFFVLAPEHRRATYAWNLLHSAFDRLGNRTVGADAVLEKVHTYSHYGFSFCYHTRSYHGVASSQRTTWRLGVESASGTPIAELNAYDATNTGAPRPAFLRAWLALPESRTLVYKRDGRLCGLGSIRRCHRGMRIGPLQADDPEAAEALFDALTACFPGEEIAIDCPENNPAIEALLKKKHLVAGPQTARLYRGGPPPPSIPWRIYGLMSFALG